jgi:hypothetical protein
MMKKVLLAAGIFCVAVSAVGFGQGFSAGDRTFTMNGSGTSDDNLVNNSFMFEGSLGWFLTDAWEFSIRQGVGRVDLPDGDDWNGSTRLGLDLNFNMGTIVPFIGANIGYLYGDSVSDTWFGGPEGGLRWFVNDTTYLLFMAEYQIFFRNLSDIDNSFDDGRFVYTAGVGFRF